MNKMAEIESVDSFGSYSEPGTLHLERILPGPVERVWAYLTEPEKRAKWFASGVMASTVGDSFELLFNNQTLGKSGETPRAFQEIREQDHEQHADAL